MTKEFDKFINFILEATSFLDLPDELPYGFWVSPIGEFFVVNFQEHEEVAFEIIESKANFFEEYNSGKGNTGSCTNFLSEKKYIRIAKMFNELTGDIFYVDEALNRNVVFEPTNSSTRTANDIAAFYNTKISFLKK